VRKKGCLATFYIASSLKPFIFLSHMLHPHPDFEDELRIELPSPLAGAILTSPWVKFPTDDNSVERVRKLVEHSLSFDAYKYSLL
jgi:hypothetical protein